MTVHDLQRTRFARHWLGVFTVLVFGFRALVPTGYMIAAVDGHTRLVMCPAGIYFAAGVHPMTGMDHGSAMSHAGHATLTADQCPFALAGGAGLLAAVHVPATPHFVTLQPAHVVSVASVPAAPPSRYHAPRGPPSPA